MAVLDSNQKHYSFFFLWYETLLSFWLFTSENNVAVGNQIFILLSEIKCLGFPIQIQCFILNTVLMWSQKEIKCRQNWSERWSPKVDLRCRRKTQNSLSNLIRFSGYIYLFAAKIKDVGLLRKKPYYILVAYKLSLFLSYSIKVHAIPVLTCSKTAFGINSW